MTPEVRLPPAVAELLVHAGGVEVPLTARVDVEAYPAGEAPQRVPITVTMPDGDQLQVGTLAFVGPEDWEGFRAGFAVAGTLITRVQPVVAAAAKEALDAVAMTGHEAAVRASEVLARAAASAGGADGSVVSDLVEVAREYRQLAETLQRVRPPRPKPDQL